MVAGVIYGLAGVTTQIPNSVNVEIIERGLNSKSAISLETLRSTVQNLSGRAIFNSKEGSYTIDARIKVIFPSLKDALSIYEAAQSVKKLSILVGITTLVVGAWKSILEESPLKALGTVIIAFAAAYFAWQAQLTQKKPYSLRQQSENLVAQVLNFRKDVIIKGLSQFSSSTNLLSESLRACAIEFLTEDEIKNLFEECIEGLLKSSKENENLVRAMANNLLEKLSPTSCFLREAKYFFIVKARFRSLFKKFKDESENQIFLILINKRFTKSSAYIINEFDKVDALNCAFSEPLSRLCKEPNLAENADRVFQAYYSTMTGLQFSRVFREVFSRTGMEPSEYNTYIEWARTQFNAIPKGTQYRELLIELLPEKKI